MTDRHTNTSLYNIDAGTEILNLERTLLYLQTTKTKLLRPCRNEREWFWRKQGWFSSNSEVEATWASLIIWNFADDSKIIKEFRLEFHRKSSWIELLGIPIISFCPKIPITSLVVHQSSLSKPTDRKKKSAVEWSNDLPFKKTTHTRRLSLWSVPWHFSSIKIIDKLFHCKC